MSNQSNNASKFANIIKLQIQNYQAKALYSEVGRVINVADGIVQATGLNNVMLNEVVLFENGSQGLAFNLEANSCGIVMLGPYADIKENSIVKRTKQLISVPVGDALLGRVINPLGHPIDGLTKLVTKQIAPVEKPAPGVMERKAIDQPLETGIMAIDAMFPIGKGQRELVIGDKQTGKTTVAIDMILNQKNKNVKCVYVFVGQKNATVIQFVEILKLHNALDYTCVVAATAADLPALNYLAPFAGITIAEAWMHKGQDVLIVYDDLSKHAIAYRTLSLLLRRPPGREAYPGDVFYLHSRLLERSGRLNKASGGGSITAIPIVETEAGDISAYIPTNVISITDGQLFMLSNLFNAGQRPAIDVGFSVSRVGSAAQTKAMKKGSGSLKLDLAEYRELDAFSQFGSDLDEETQAILQHGKKVMNLLKQDKHQPLAQTAQVLLLQTIKEKHIKNIPLEQISLFKEEIIKHFEKEGHIFAQIAAKNDVDATLQAELDAAIVAFVAQFLQLYDKKKSQAAVDA